MKRAMIGGAVIALVIATAGAVDLSANTIIPGCQAALSNDWSNPLAGYCLGAVDGIAHTAIFPDSVLTPWLRNNVNN